VISGDASELGERSNQHLLPITALDVVAAVSGVEIGEDDNGCLCGDGLLKRPNQGRVLVRREAAGDIDSLQDATVRGNLGERLRRTVPARTDPQRPATRQQQFVDGERL